VSTDEVSKLGGSFWHLDGIRLSLADKTTIVAGGIDRHARA
jgi:hypothetical protein